MRRQLLVAPLNSLLITGVLAAALLGLSINASAQEGGLQITSAVTEDWPAVEATVTVLDASGEPVTGLTADAFEAGLDGQTLPVSDITTASDPSIGIAVVLVFDVSGSMEGEPLEAAKAAGKALVSGLGETDQAAVLAFSDGVTVVQGFTVDKPALDQAIDSLAAGGNTDLYAAVREAADLARQAELPRSAVVVLSDGVDFGVAPTISREDSLRVADESGATFMTIGLGPAIDGDYLAGLAVGNGQFLQAPSPGELVDLYTAAGNILRQQYVLSLDASNVPQTQGGSATLAIAVTVDGVTTEASTSISTPAPASTPAPTATATPAPTPVPTVTPTVAAAVTAPTEDKGSSTPMGWIMLVGVVGAVAAGGVGAYSLSRRRQAAGQATEAATIRERPRESAPLAFPEITRAAAENASAWLEQEDGTRTPLDSPVTAGFTPDCSVCLGDDESRPERIRVWQRDGRYMLHNLSRVGSVSVAGQPATWVILEDGDEIELGGVRLVFREPD